jgi:hypothetical protein
LIWCYEFLTVYIGSGWSFSSVHAPGLKFFSGQILQLHSFSSMIFLLLGFGSVRFLIRVPALPDSSLIRRWRTECPSLVSSMAACEERLFFCSFEPTHVLSQCLKRAPIFGSAVRLWFHHRQSTCCHFPITRARFHASCGLIRVRRTRWVRLQPDPCAQDSLGPASAPGARASCARSWFQFSPTAGHAVWFSVLPLKPSSSCSLCCQPW